MLIFINFKDLHTFTIKKLAFQHRSYINIIMNYRNDLSFFLYRTKYFNYCLFRKKCSKWDKIENLVSFDPTVFILFSLIYFSLTLIYFVYSSILQRVHTNLDIMKFICISVMEYNMFFHSFIRNIIYSSSYKDAQNNSIHCDQCGKNRLRYILLLLWYVSNISNFKSIPENSYTMLFVECISFIAHLQKHAKNSVTGIMMIDNGCKWVFRGTYFKTCVNFVYYVIWENS